MGEKHCNVQNEYSISLRATIDNVTSKMILWRVPCGGKKAADRRPHKEKVLRVEVKLNMDKHYIIYNHINSWAGEEEDNFPYLHIIISE